MSEPSKESIEYVAKWQCMACSESGVNDAECSDCEQRRRFSAFHLDAFAAKAVAAELGELEKRAVEDRDTWSSLKLYDKANAVDAIVVAIRVRFARARGKDVENENA